MSHWASTWAYEQEIQPSGKKFVLVALANFADEDGFCYPSQETLAVMTGQTARSVRSHLASLEEDGIIQRKHRRGKTGQRTSDGYTLKAPPHKLKPKRKIIPVVQPENLSQEKVSADPLVDKVDPSVKKDPPLPPKGYKQPPVQVEPKTINPPANFLVTDSMYVWLAEMCFSFSDQELVDATGAWRDSRESKPSRLGRTVPMWQADWKKFIRIYWEIRQRNGNGHKQAESESNGNPSFMAPLKPKGWVDETFYKR